jgi:single-strand DNA-binding protein
MNGTPITIVGNLTDDPELRFTPSGAAVVKFSVAFNRRIFDAQANEWKDGPTDFHRVTAWRQLAQNIAETLKKGSRVLVQGDLRQHQWTDKDTNQPRSGWEINAESVGAELTWATAVVTKTKSAARGETAPDDPWATGSKQRPAATAGAPAGASGYSDEPPF